MAQLLHRFDPSMYASAMLKSTALQLLINPLLCPYASCDYEGHLATRVPPVASTVGIPARRIASG